MADNPVRTIKIRNFIDALQLKKDMSFSDADLSTAMAEQASLFVHYASIAAKSSRQVDDTKMLLENAEARVYRKYRDEAVNNGTKMTEAQLEKAVSIHPQVVAIKKALNEAKQIEAVAKAAAEGLRHRRDMLVQRGLLSREEMKGDLSIARRQEREHEEQSQRDRVLANIRRQSTEEN